MGTFGFSAKMVGGVFCGALLAVSTTGHASAAVPAPGGVTPSPAIAAGGIGMLALTGPIVPLGCASSGGSQDIAKSAFLKNTASVALAKGTVLSWKATDGDAGKVTLEADLAVGATVKVQGAKPGNEYTCTASYAARPDLRVKRVFLSGPMQATVELANADPYADAAPSKVRLDIGICGSTRSPSRPCSGSFATSPGPTSGRP